MVDDSAACLEGLEGVTFRTIGAGDLVTLSQEIEASRQAGTDAVRAASALADLRLPAYSRVINLSHSPLSAWVSARIPAEGREGGYFSTNGEWLYAGDWLTLVVALIDFRADNAFNIVDLYRASAGAPPPSADARLFMTSAESHHPSIPSPSGDFVALCPGAAPVDRRVPSTTFAGLVDALEARGVTTLLVGLDEDRALVAEIAALCKKPPAIACGQIDAAELAGILRRARVVVTNASVFVPMAAAMGTWALLPAAQLEEQLMTGRA
jgi:ADP-heptose:LPS heptosyltransferase